MRPTMILLPGLIALAFPAAAQVSIGNGVVRSGNTVIDATGVHTGTTRVDATGVHTGATRVDAGGVRVQGGAITLRTNGNNRQVDCGGGALEVDGNSNVLDIVRCGRVTVNGNNNRLHAAFAAAGSLSVMGNHNEVVWSAPRTVRVGVSNPGTGNTVTRR